MVTLSLQRQSGIGFLELIVSLLLASIITAAAVGMLVTDSQTSRFQINATAAHTSGRFAFDFILADLRKAGWSDQTPVPVAVEGDNGVNAGDNDVLRIRYDAAISDNRDCVGNATLAVTPSSNEVVNEYKIEQIDGESVLTCNGQTLMGNVEGLQVLLGVDGNADGSPDQYLQPDLVQANDPVVSVQLAMLVATREASGEVVAQQFRLLDETTGSIVDGKGRTVFTTTERIRNISMDDVL